MVLVFQALSSTAVKPRRPVRKRGLGRVSKVKHPNPRMQEVSGNLSHVHVPNVESSSVAPLPLLALSFGHRGASHPSKPITKLCEATGHWRGHGGHPGLSQEVPCEAPARAPTSKSPVFLKAVRSISKDKLCSRENFLLLGGIPVYFNVVYAHG